MAIYEVTLTQSYYGQICINRWNYVSGGITGGTIGSVACLIALGMIPDNGSYREPGLATALQNNQNNQVQFLQVLCRNLYSVEDFFENPYVPALNGQGAGEGLSPATAYGFTTNRVRTDIRRGQKRFVGVSEPNVLGGGVIASGSTTTLLNDLANFMSTVVEYDDNGNTITFSPAVCGKEVYTPDPLAPEKKAYRYYPTEAAQLANTAVGVRWQLKTQVRTQTSRQYGRGR